MLIALLALIGAPDIAVVHASKVLPETTPADVGATVSELTAAGKTCMSQSALVTRLTGMRAVAQPDLTALAALFEEARALEAHFDTEGARGRREEILAAFAQALRPDRDLATLAARACHDLAAAVASQPALARARAAECLAHFDQPLDALRYPPAVQELFTKAAPAPAATLTLDTDQSGELRLDGKSLGTIQPGGHVAVAPGVFRVWLVRDGQVSLPHEVDLSKNDARLAIDLALESRMVVAPYVGIECEPCEAEHTALEQRLGTPVVFAGATVAKKPLPVRTEVATTSAFSPWWLAPLGVAQFQQGRPIVGGSFLAAELGALSWHLYALNRHQHTLDDQFLVGEPKWRKQRNASAVLLYSTLAAGLAESLITGFSADAD